MSIIFYYFIILTYGLQWPGRFKLDKLHRATSYNVYRGTTSGTHGTTVATGGSGTSYTDSTITNGTSYYYVVTAVNSYGESGNSNEASATPSSGGGGTYAEQWDFNGSGDTGSRLLTHDLTGSTSGGSLNLTATGTDPYMISPDNLGFSASNNHIYIRMENNTSDTGGQIFFTTTSDTSMDETKSVHFSTNTNSAYTVYDVDMSSNTHWTGTIKQIRFDPSGSSGTIEIDYIHMGT